MRLAKNFGCVLFPLMLGAAAFAQSQQQTPPPAPPPSSQNNQSPPPAAPAAKKPNTADDNPFPEDISKKAAQGADAAPEAPPASGAPADPNAPPRSTPAEDTTSSSRSKFEGLGDMTSEDTSRISNGAGGYIVNPKMASEDVKIGGFYLDRRDYKGAYVRFKEATLVDPENADAVFGLAEAARGMNHKDEAVQNYRVYLDASPEGKKAKEARKALALLGEAPNEK